MLGAMIGPMSVEDLRFVWGVLVALTLMPSLLSLLLHAIVPVDRRDDFWWFVFIDLLGFVLVLATVFVSIFWQPRPAWFDAGRVPLFGLIMAAVYWRLWLQFRSLLRKRNRPGGRHR